MPKTKAGEKISWKEFMRRWGKGIERVSAYQQVKMQIISTWIILIGVLCGFIITLFAFKQVWWLTIILGGALFNTSIQLLGLWQKKKLLSRFNVPSVKEETKSVTIEGEGYFPSSFFDDDYDKGGDVK